MVCPKFNSHVYKLKRWNLGVHICFYFATRAPKRCFYWVNAQCSQKIVDGPINMVPLEKVVSSPMIQLIWITMGISLGQKRWGPLMGREISCNQWEGPSL
jgi:hypothetical protein